MDFIKGNEQVKIDANAVDLCGNNHITLGTELITIDNEKTGTESSTTTLAPDYIKLSGYESQQPAGQEGVITLNRNEGKLTTYLNGAWTNILTGTSNVVSINDSRLRIQDAHNTVANGIYTKNDTYSSQNVNGDVYVNENGCKIERDFVFANVSSSGWTQGTPGTVMENFEYFVAGENTHDYHLNASREVNAHLTSIVNQEEGEFVRNLVIAVDSNTSNKYPFIGLLPALWWDWESEFGTWRTIGSDTDVDMYRWVWHDGTPYEPNKGHYTNWYYLYYTSNGNTYYYPRNIGYDDYNCRGSSIQMSDDGHSEPTNVKWLPHPGAFPIQRAIYKRPKKSTDIWRVYYDILGNSHTLYEIKYTNPSTETSLIGSNITSDIITGYDYINKNIVINSDNITIGSFSASLDPNNNVAVTHPNYSGIYYASSSLDSTHHIEWTNGNYKISWNLIPDNTSLNTNKHGWCLLDNSVIKYFTTSRTVDSITTGYSNPWDTTLLWQAADGAESTLPIINQSTQNTNLEKNLSDWVVSVTGSTYSKANGTYRRDRSENINNHHVYYNEHGLKLYYGPLEYNGETPNNNVAVNATYTIDTWMSGASHDRLDTSDYADDFTANGNDSLIGYEYKITTNTHSTWDDGETAAINVYSHLASFQTSGNEKLIKRMADDTLGSSDNVWFGMFYDGETPSANATDPAWKFIDRTRTFDEGTTNATIVWEGSYPNTSGAKGVYMNGNRKLGHGTAAANNRAIFKRPQMWVPGTGTLSEYEYLHVPIPGYTWDMHETKAQELGGHLVSIHSAEEIEFISTLANFGMKEDDATSKVSGYHIGLNSGANRNDIFDKNSHTLSYSDGTPYDFKFSSFNDPHSYYDNDLGLRINAAFYGSAIIEWWTGTARSRKTQYFVAGLATDDARKGGVSGSSGAGGNYSNGVGAIYKRKRNSWRIVDGKDTIYRFGEPTISNTGNYVDTIEPLVMQPVYRNTQETTVQNPARVVDGNYVTRTVANLIVSNYGNSDYNGVYNYSNFKTDSTRKWVKSDNANITIEYKKNTEISDPSGYRWHILNNNGSYINDIVKRGPYTNDPWDTDNYSWITDGNSSLNIEKVVTATTNTETNVQITGQLSGAGSTTNVNIEHGITMTEGTDATDSTVSIDKTNGISIQNTNLDISGGNMTLTNGNINVYNTETAVIANNGGTLRLGESNQSTQLFGSKVYVGGNTIGSNDILYFMKQASSGLTFSDLEIGGGLPGANKATIHCSYNLHIDSPSNYDLYLNHYSSKNTFVRNYVAHSSDERIKKNIELVDDDEALNKILALETKKFNYIDIETTHKEFGFIAQDVEKIIPDAVCRTEGFGAELMLECDFTYVYCSPDEENRREYYILTIDTDILEDGVKYRVKHNGQENELIANVINGVTIMKLQDKWEFGDILKILIVGKCVDDFLRVKHDMIYCLHHSAIQELSRRNDEKTIKIDTLETLNQQKDEKIVALEERITAIEKLLQEKNITNDGQKVNSIFKTV